ncbi:hypothetical protein P154DRAFT_520666 [Amniculicola lignicola CBS 123094]|uniref:Mitochondrial carrier protein pet8 n=1 Tax=Amniculicola lignicola CBS 123094 TaxID=1392246 RepID=A0A6A5WRV5_9PLEO|nr:hypothetical protein P154DRAFT_520666 [Amniculicola lignicola CBS 123094]
MSVFRTLIARRGPVVSYSIVQRASIHSTIPRLAGKESALHHEGRESEIEKDKQDMLKEQKEGKGSWKEGLASDSESIVKADRGEAESTEETIKKLQKEAEKVGKKNM